MITSSEKGTVALSEISTPRHIVMNNSTVNESLLMDNATEVATTAAPTGDSMMFYLEMFWYFALSMIGLVLYFIFYAVIRHHMPR